MCFLLQVFVVVPGIIPEAAYHLHLEEVCVENKH